MDTLTFLQSIFNGYCNCYSTLNWHSSASYTDMTQSELQYFVQLGNMLGFLACRGSERMDLCWRDPQAVDNELVLYLERENNNVKALDETLDKLLLSKQSKDAKYLVGVFGWLTRNNYDNAVKEIRKDIGGRNLLMIAFIGCHPEKEADWYVEGVIWSEGKEYHRQAKAEMDKGRYWYIYFPAQSAWPASDDSLTGHFLSTL